MTNVTLREFVHEFFNFIIVVLIVLVIHTFVLVKEGYHLLRTGISFKLVNNSEGSEGTSFLIINLKLVLFVCMLPLYA